MDAFTGISGLRLKGEAAEEDQRQRSQRRAKSGGEQQHVDRLAFLLADNQFIKQCFLKNWLVTPVNVETRIDIYNIAEEEIEFDNE